MAGEWGTANNEGQGWRQQTGYLKFISFYINAIPGNFSHFNYRNSYSSANSEFPEEYNEYKAMAMPKEKELSFFNLR